MQFKTIFIFEINNGEIAHVCVLWLLMNMMFLSKWNWLFPWRYEM